MSQFSASSLLGRFSRRRFVQGLAAGGAVAALGRPGLSLAEQQRLRTGAKVLSGTRFDLTYSPTPVNFTGAARYATAIKGSVPAPTLRFREADHWAILTYVHQRFHGGFKMAQQQAAQNEHAHSETGHTH